MNFVGVDLARSLMTDGETMRSMNEPSCGTAAA
jgi:hypothetical protein